MSASFPQRVVVNIRRGATVILPGTVGASRLIDDTASRNGWDLALEHEYGGAWRPNIRAVLGKWTEADGLRSQLIHSKDVDWPGRDNRERNLIIRIERADVPRPSAQPVAAATRAGTEWTAPRDERQGLARRATESVERGAGAGAEWGAGRVAERVAGLSSGAGAGAGVGRGGAVPGMPVGAPTTAARAARPATSSGAEAPVGGAGRISTSGGGAPATGGRGTATSSG
ncbi:hypothetical protein [Kitasatospora mediocidica]|uniref:hypothetical protein n=1 Tax=Kitasatospora mediocidica TaxID=58352 RepID=UPI00056A8638|nr:hypothetical protein [Kitasatospora mediocidica]